MITFKIVTPHGVTYEDEIEKVTIPTTSGEITILENHAPLISVLKPGELVIHKKGFTSHVAVSGGFFEIRPESEVYVMADTAEREEHIDIQRAEDAMRRAEELLKQVQHTDDIEYARIQALIEKELTRLHVGKKYKKLPS